MFSTDVVSISPIGFPTVGENYTLECSANGSMVTFEWLGQPDGSTSVVNTSSITINSNSITSQLRFRPLQQSHSGPYTCHATWNGSSHLSRPIRIDAIGIAIITLLYPIIPSYKLIICHAFSSQAIYQNH